MKTYNQFIKESIDNYFLKRKYMHSKYDRIVVRINDFNDRKIFFETIDDYGVHIKYDKRTYPIKKDYIIFLKDNKNNIYEPLPILYNMNFDYFDSGEYIKDYPNTYPILINPNEINHVIEEILHIDDVNKLYEPKYKNIQRTF